MIRELIMYECAFQFTKFCVSKMGLDGIALMEEVLLQAWESVFTGEIPRHEEKGQRHIPNEHLFSGSGFKTNGTRWSSTCEKVLRVLVHRKLKTEPGSMCTAPASSDCIVSRRLLVLLGVP